MGALSKLLHPAAFRKPELLWRPAQLWRRLRWRRGAGGELVELDTAWGLPVCVSPSERIGEALSKTGSYDTGMLEVLARLVDPGESCLDVGANFGLVTGVLALAAGSRGKVRAFEPHPGLRARLEGHVQRWREQHAGALAEIEIDPTAISDRGGAAELHIPADFARNEGSASLEGGGEDVGESVTVARGRLDDLVGSGSEVGVLKIDIEGHEKAALEGAAGLLRRRAVRDIVFEDHEGYPSPVSDLLEAHGYQIWLIRKGLFKPRLMAPGTPPYELPNYLASADPERAGRRMAALGYRVLSAGFSNCEASG